MAGTEGRRGLIRWMFLGKIELQVSTAERLQVGTAEKSERSMDKEFCNVLERSMDKAFWTV